MTPAVDVAAVALRVDQARYWALCEQPFYGALLARLQVMPGKVETLSTNGRVIFYNPAFIATLPDAQLRGVLLHETLHPAHGHLWRAPVDRFSNEAGDHEINLTLEGVEGVELPPGALRDPRFRNMAFESIRRVLMDEAADDGQDDQQDGGQQGGQGDGDGQGDGGEPNPCGDFSEPDAGDAGQDAGAQAAQAEQLRQDWSQAVQQAAQAAQALRRGDLPADLKAECERLQRTRLDWKRELADFIKSADPTRADWSRPARRHAWQSVLLPSKRADGLGLLVIVRDTSGSIDGRTNAEFCAAVDSAIAETGARALVIDADAEVAGEYWLGQGDECPLTYQGGGGTDFRPAFARAAQLADEGERIAGLVYLTDLEGPEPEACDFPALWVCTTDRVAKTGRTIRLDLN